LATSKATLPFGDAPDSVNASLLAHDRAARERAVDPRFNVALEASAGTGKTRVLVDRYINLLRAGVNPANILAITFTRKAAAEMRDRILTTLRAAAARGELPPARWRELHDRMSDIAISTIDAFCLSLLREFPLEAKPTSIPAFRSRTRRNYRGSWTRRSTVHCASAGRPRETTSRWRSCLRNWASGRRAPRSRR
jgi:hypothetical protein